MKFRIILKSFNNELINLACEQLNSVLIKTDCNLTGIVSLPIRIKRFCVLRSPHVDKDSREHFEIRIHKRFIDIKTTTASTIDLILKTELPSGVSSSLKVLQNN